MISKMASRHQNAIKKLPQAILTKKVQPGGKGLLLPSLLIFPETGLKNTQNEGAHTEGAHFGDMVLDSI